MDWDEEIKRQAAISALLAPPEDGQSPPLDTRTDEQVVAQPENKSDWHKLADQVFDTKTDEQVTPSSDYPAVQLPDKKYDTQVAESAVPYGEGEKPAAPVSDYAPKDTGKGAAPEDYPTIAQDQGKGESSGQQAPDALTQVERAPLVKLPPQVRRAELVDPDPDRNYFELNQAEPVPGFVPGSQNAIVNPAAGVIPPIPKPKYPDQIVTPDEASGKTSVVNAPVANAPVALAPADQVIQPKTTDDWSKLADSIWPSVKSTITEAGNVGTLKAGTGDRVDPQELYSYLLGKFSNSGLVGYVPPDGERWGIKTGSAAEWAAFGLAVARQESGFNAKSYNPHDPGGSAGIFQFGQGQTQFTDGVDQFNPQGSADAFIKSVKHYVVNHGDIASMGETFGSIRRPDEAGQYIPWAQGVAGQAPAAAAAAEQPQSFEDLAKDWVKLSPDEQAGIEKGTQTKQQGILSDLQNKLNMPDFVHALEQPIDGVPDAIRKATLDDAKAKITAYAQDYYKESDPAKAYARIMKAPDAGTFGGEIISKLGPNFMHAWLSAASQADSPTQTKLIDFINTIQPDASPESRANLVKQVLSMQGKDRVDFVNHLYNTAQQTHPDTVKDVNMMSLLDSIDVASQPGEQAREQANHARVLAAVVQNTKDLREDPTMKGTIQGTVADALAAAPKNLAELIPVIGQSAMFSEIYTDTQTSLRAEHPDWTDTQIKARAASLSLPQDVLQELINAGTMGIGPIAKGVAGIPNPVARILTSAILHGTTTGSAGVIQQGFTNLQTGRPIGENVLESGIAAATQGIVGGAWAGRHGVEPVPEHVPVEPPLERPTSQYRPQEPPLAEHGPSTRPDEPFSQYNPPETPLREHGPPDVTGPEFGPAKPLSPVSRADILGPEETGTPPIGERWHDPGPIVTRGVERETFTPQELSQAVSRLSDAGMSPDQIHQVISQLRPGYEQGIQSVRLGAEGDLEAARTRQMQANQPPIPIKLPAGEAAQQRFAPQLTARPEAPEFTGLHTIPASAIAQARMEQARARAEAKLSDQKTEVAPLSENLKITPPSPSEPPPRLGSADAMTGNAGVEEPWESRIANKYVKERMANGEIGEVEPGTGKTTQQLLAEGLMMGPEEINQHMSDIMSGKGDPVAQTAAMRAEEARLSQRSHETSLIAEADPTNQEKKIAADNALKDLTDLYNGPMKRLKQNWHRQGVAFQDRIPIDLSTYNGIRAEFIRSTGKTEVPAQAEEGMRKSAAQVRGAGDNLKAKMQKLGSEAEKNGARRKLPSIDQVAEDVMKIMGHDPCPA